MLKWGTEQEIRSTTDRHGLEEINILHPNRARSNIIPWRFKAYY
jgi:hypothetical protein